MWGIETKHLKVKLGEWEHFGPGKVTGMTGGLMQFEFDTTGRPDMSTITQVIVEYRGIRLTFTKWVDLDWWRDGFTIRWIDCTSEELRPEYSI